MGYHVSIVRTRGGQQIPITEEEILSAINSSSIFKADRDVRNEFIVTITTGNDLPPCLWYSDGELWAKNPDDQTVDCMCELAAILGARVRGDELETYRSSSDVYLHPDDEAVRTLNYRTSRDTARRSKRRSLILNLSLAGLVLLLGFGGAFFSSRRTPARDPISNEVITGTSCDIAIIPTEEFPADELIQLAATVSKNTGLRVKTMLPLGTRDWKPYPNRSQYNPMTLTALAMPVVERLKSNYGGKVHVILTSSDIGPPDGSLNFVFSQNDHANKISVVSAARMLHDQHGMPASPELIRTRLRKMLLRTIALQYYGMDRSADIRDVTYSPLMGLADLDDMGFTMGSR
jgi:predicted Zn-dependent protease